MDDTRKVTLHVSDWSRIAVALNDKGIATPAIDKLLQRKVANVRRPLVRDWDWWARLIGLIGESHRSLALSIIGQASRTPHGSNVLPVDPEDLAAAEAYLGQEDDRWDGADVLTGPVKPDVDA